MVVWRQQAKAQSPVRFDLPPDKWAEEYLVPLGQAPMEDVPSQEESELNMIVKEPLYGACRLAIRRLGKRVFELEANMDDIAERVARRDPSNFPLRFDMITRAWRGVGYWVS